MTSTDPTRYVYPLKHKVSRGDGPTEHQKRDYTNWQSDNAVDLLTPVRTPIYAVASGKIGTRPRYGFGPSKSADPLLAGLKIHLETSDNVFYYTHLIEFAPGIKPGVAVSAGDLIGYTGTANGVAHLHFAVKKGDVLRLLEDARLPDTVGSPWAATTYDKLLDEVIGTIGHAWSAEALTDLVDQLGGPYGMADFAHLVHGPDGLAQLLSAFQSVDALVSFIHELDTADLSFNSLLESTGLDNLSQLVALNGVKAMSSLVTEIGVEQTDSLIQGFGAEGLSALIEGLGAKKLSIIIKNVGADRLNAAAERVGAGKVSSLVSAVGVDATTRLVQALGVDDLGVLVEALGIERLGALVGETGASEVTELLRKVRTDGLAQMVQSVGVENCSALVGKIGIEGVATLLNELGANGVAALVDEIRVTDLASLVEVLGTSGLITRIDECGGIGALLALIRQCGGVGSFASTLAQAGSPRRVPEELAKNRASTTSPPIPAPLSSIATAKRPQPAKTGSSSSGPPSRRQPARWRRSDHGYFVPPNDNGGGGGGVLVSPLLAAPRRRTSAAPSQPSVGGVDFSTLELRYLAEVPDEQSVAYAFRAALAETTGDAGPGHETAKQASDSFFVWLALPRSSFTVNLNPAEPDRIIDHRLGRTDAGRAMLEADLRLKKTVASLIHPDTAEGAAFWKEFDPVDGDGQSSLTGRLWIVPSRATVWDSGETVYVVDAPLDVCRETELAGSPTGMRRSGSTPPTASNGDFARRVDAYYRSEILPQVVTAVNTSPDYAQLRRVYLSRVVAEWYRRRWAIGGAFSSLIGCGDVAGWESPTPWDPHEVFERYLTSQREGEFDVVRPVPRGATLTLARHFYGGVDFSRIPRQSLSLAAFEARMPTARTDVASALDAPAGHVGHDAACIGGFSFVTAPASARDSAARAQRTRSRLLSATGSGADARGSISVARLPRTPS